VWNPEAPRIQALQLRLTHTARLVWATSLPGPGGSTDVVAGFDDGTIVTCEAAAGASPRRRSASPPRTAVSVAAAGPGLLLIRTPDDGALLWNARLGTGTPAEWPLSGGAPSEAVECLVQVGELDPLRATVTENGVEIGDPGSAEASTVLTDHSVPVTSLAAVPMSGYAILATAAPDGTVRLYRVDADDTVAPAGVVVCSARGGWAFVAADGRSYKAERDVSDVLWWAAKLNRFEVGELDAFEPSIRRIPDEEPVLP